MEDEGLNVNADEEGKIRSVLSLPNELLADVLEFLEPRDVRNFSLCSKESRNRAVRAVMKNVALTQKSAQEFADGGGLAGYRGAVRHIRIAGLSGSTRLPEKHELLKRYCKVLPLFVNLRSLHILITCCYRLTEGAFLDAIFASVRKLNVKEVLFDSLGAPAVGEYELEKQYWALQPGIPNPLEPVKIEESRDPPKPIVVYPPTLATLTINLTELSWSFTHLEKFFAVRAGVSPMLRNLKIIAYSYDSRVPADYDIRTNTIEFKEEMKFLQVRKLEIVTQREMFMGGLWEVIQLFPGLEDLVITCERGFGRTFPVDGVAYYFLNHLATLKYLTLPHPRQTGANASLNRATEDSPNSIFYNQARLQRTIRNLVATGLKSLQRVRFKKPVRNNNVEWVVVKGERGGKMWTVGEGTVVSWQEINWEGWTEEVETLDEVFTDGVWVRGGERNRLRGVVEWGTGR
ncbi:hypothetical protein ABW19_dt0210592 [Dactylella cylindrospora]|nr:hypothetical protein ABW19_dt0210592 [Dactylella cylindrospora]